jgi:TonB family protein
MKCKGAAPAFVLAILSGGAIVAPPAAFAQAAPSPAAAAAATDAGKRKVRSKVTPEYPDLAKQMSVTGKVKIEATIAADGHVAGTKVVGGSPLLVNASLEALKKWRFEAGPKETTETIEFEFNGQ